MNNKDLYEDYMASFETTEIVQKPQLTPFGKVMWYTIVASILTAPIIVLGGIGWLFYALIVGGN